MRTPDKFAIIIFSFFIGFIIGIVFLSIISSTGENSSIKTDELNEYCEMKYGEGYSYMDDTSFGLDLEINCHKNPIETEWSCPMLLEPGMYLNRWNGDNLTLVSPSGKIINCNMINDAKRSKSE